MEFLRTLADRLSLKRAALALLLGCACLATPAQSQNQDREYALKAVFLYNFCQFIDWPPESFAGGNDPIVIGVLGGNPFGSLLNETVRNEIVRGRPIRLQHYQKLEDVGKCHILFISAGAPAWVARYLDYFHRRNIVTVGETPEFLNQGGMIALVADQNRVRLRVNLPAVRSGKIEMSSKLLRVADTYR